MIEENAKDIVQSESESHKTGIQKLLWRFKETVPAPLSFAGKTESQPEVTSRNYGVHQ